MFVVCNARYIGGGYPIAPGALIDDGPRSATIKAATDVTAFGLTSWEFRPFVEANASIAWQLLQVMAKRLRGFDIESTAAIVTARRRTPT